jgi:pimeloyl-ACP methyl ester carboxylesterase
LVNRRLLPEWEGKMVRGLPVHKSGALRRTFAAVGLVGAVIFSLAVVSPQGAGAAEEAATAVSHASTNCTPETIDVTGGQIVGKLCRPSAGSSTLLITVSGATYGSAYWDFPYEPATYSFVDAMVSQGYAVLNIDRLGIGSSSHPSSIELTTPLDALSIHQVIQAAKAGDLGGASFDRYVLVGHSLGSGIAETEAATYHDVDALIITSLAQRLNYPNFVAGLATFYPAMLDPKFLGKITDPGYLTSLPGTRGKTFYYLPNADPKAIATDEATKQTVTAGELATVYPFVVPGAVCALLGGIFCNVPNMNILNDPVPKVTVPVLMVLGQEDDLICGGVGTNCSSDATVQQEEAPFWSGAPCFQAHVIPDAGHDLNLQENAQVWYHLAGSWLNNLTVTPSGTYGCSATSG